MTDVYVSCVNEDAAKMRLVVEGLRAEGWRVWFEPDATPQRRESAIDAELGAAGAVVVMWSDMASRSEFVRTEAATGLYRNKLIQVKMGDGQPPRPFDQIDVIDLSSWRGGDQDASWRRVVEAVRLFAGAPGADRPQVVRKSAAGFASEAAARPGRVPMGGEAGVGVIERKPAAEPTPVFEAPLDDAPPAAASSSMARAFSQPAEPEATADVVPGQSADSPISAAVSEAERKISDAITTQNDDETDDEMFAEQPEAPVETSRHASLFADREPAPAPAPPEANEPIVFARREPPPEPEMPARESALSFDDGPRRSNDPLDMALSETRSAAKPSRGRPNGVAPVAVVGALAIVGGGMWFVDPLGWRQGGEKSAFAEGTLEVPAGGAIQTTGPVSLAATDTLMIDIEAEALWEEVDRADPVALREFILAHRNSMSGEAARAHLRVLDSQAWADAVTADVETEYEAYLARFPAPTGEMAGAAANRLASLGEERRQAITTIQTQLRELAIYGGESTGTADEASQQAAVQFARRFGGQAPDLGTSAPRDLRRFGDQVLDRVRAEATTASEVTQVAAVTNAAVAADAGAEVVRPAPEAEPEVATPETATPVEGEEVVDEAPAAVDEESARLAAWESATLAGTVDAYAVFLRDYPDSPRAQSARVAIEQLSRPAAYGLDWLAADTRAAVEAARGAQTQATQRASAARGIADQADEVATRARSGLEDARTVVAPDGDIYETEVAGNQPNGLGVRTAGDAQSSGDRYRGQLQNGLGQGLGVYEYGDNPNNQAAQALRYEGEHAGDVASGFGVTQWRNGNRFEGQDSGETERGVMTFANGQRYEGEMRNGARHGFGVFWTGDGDVMMAGRWENGDLVEPMSPWTGPDIPALVAAVGPAVEPEIGPEAPASETGEPAAEPTL